VLGIPDARAFPDAPPYSTKRVASVIAEDAVQFPPDSECRPPFDHSEWDDWRDEIDDDLDGLVDRPEDSNCRSTGGRSDVSETDVMLISDTASLFVLV
jgi:hypothetical protein